MSSPGQPALVELLTTARDLGFLGPSDLAPQIEHARGFGAVLQAAGISETAVLADLGAGGGLPSLVLLTEAPGWRFVLVETMAKRARFLRDAVAQLGAAERTTVLEARAEDVGRDPVWRGALDAVVARGFGAPAVTAECAAPLLRPHGVLVVSEPPHQADRWDDAGLASLGLAPAGTVDDPFHYRWFEQVGRCPDTVPRRSGIPRKRPLF